MKLEQNYRSTATILDAASAVIANNTERKGKTLWTENPRGAQIDVFHAPDDRAEATWVARRVQDEARNRAVRRPRRPLPDQRAVAPVRRGVPARAHPLPGRGRDAVLRAEGGQGRPRLPEARGQSRATTWRSGESSTSRRGGWATRRSTRSRPKRGPTRIAALRRGAPARGPRGALGPRASRQLGTFLEIDGRVRGARRGRAGGRRHRRDPRGDRFRGLPRQELPRGRGRPHGQRALARLGRGRVRAGGRDPDPPRLPRPLRPRLGRRRGRRAPRGHADDGPQREGARVPGRLPRGARGERLPALPLPRATTTSSKKSAGSATSRSRARASGSCSPAPMSRLQQGSRSPTRRRASSTRSPQRCSKRAARARRTSFFGPPVRESAAYGWGDFSAARPRPRAGARRSQRAAAAAVGLSRRRRRVFRRRPGVASDVRQRQGPRARGRPGRA